MAMSPLEHRCRALISELGIASQEDVRAVQPLTGGVASDIAMVDLGGRKLCVKFALPKLKVAADWHAPVHRNAAEYAWLDVAAHAAPDTGIALYGRSQTEHGFAMEFLDGPNVYLWKDHLLAQAQPQSEAQKVGAALGRIHAASTKAGFDKSPFWNRDDFRALRIDPYLSHTRRVHPDLAAHIQPLEDRLYATDSVLVHGDASPKNILFRGGAPIVLDAECATMGDPSFDPAFCLNHLALKAVHLPNSGGALLGAIAELWGSYAAHVTWDNAKDIEARVCALLPVLMLARVDGKSPVEYLSEQAKDAVRKIAIPMIKSPPKELAGVVDRLAHALAEDTV